MTAPKERGRSDCSERPKSREETPKKGGEQRDANRVTALHKHRRRRGNCKKMVMFYNNLSHAPPAWLGKRAQDLSARRVARGIVRT
jgi:hypothetical protein